MSGSGTTYNVAVSGMTTVGTVIATVGAGVAHDSGARPNVASTSTDNAVFYDAAPAACKVIGVRRAPSTPSGRDEMDVAVQDTGSGLKAITNPQVQNGVLTWQTFPQGTKNQVTVTAVKSVQGQSTTFSFDLVDMAGNVKHCA